MTRDKQDTRSFRDQHKYDHYNNYVPKECSDFRPPLLAQPQQPEMVITSVQLGRPHPHTPAHPLHVVGFGLQPLFGWPSVTPIPHSYGQPKYWRYQKPDYRRFCYSVGKAEVPYAALPGGPLYSYPTYMSENLVRRW